MEFEGFSNALELAKKETSDSKNAEISISQINKNSPNHVRSGSSQSKIKISPPKPISHKKAQIADDQEVDEDSKRATKTSSEINEEVKQLVELVKRQVLPAERIMIISSGTKSKSKRFANSMCISSFTDFVNYKPNETLQSTAIPAGELYTGKLHKNLSNAVNLLQTSYDIEHRLISPLYGLISPHKPVIPYDCTFVEKSYYIQVKMAVHRNTPFQLQQLILDPNIDTVILAFSTSFQIILDLLSYHTIKHKTVYLLRYSGNMPTLIPIGI